MAIQVAAEKMKDKPILSSNIEYIEISAMLKGFCCA